MFSLNRSALVTAIAVTFALPGAVTAEDSAKDIIEKFNKQKTRGLVIVPTAQPATDTETATSVAAPTETAYSAVDRDDQVNVQVSFDFDSATLRADQKPKLATLCEVMRAVDVSVFQIIGHTDSSGSAAYNERLSLLRAQEVKRHLVNDCGIADDRLQAVGMGESAPFDEANPRADENRRVEFQALG